jgi:hypothetical protein
MVKTKKARKLDRLTKEEILISLIWIAVLISVGIILNGTRYMTYSLIVILIGMITTLVVLNYKK